MGARAGPAEAERRGACCLVQHESGEVVGSLLHQQSWGRQRWRHAALQSNCETMRTDVAPQRQGVDDEILAARAELHEAAEALRQRAGAAGATCLGLWNLSWHSPAAKGVAVEVEGEAAFKLDGEAAFKTRPSSHLKGAVVVCLQVHRNLARRRQPLRCTVRDKGGV